MSRTAEDWLAHRRTVSRIKEGLHDAWVLLDAFPSDVGEEAQRDLEEHMHGALRAANELIGCASPTWTLVPE